MFGTNYQPSEIEEIESDWFDAYLAIERLPEFIKNMKRTDFDKIKNRIKSEHPTYSKRMKRKNKHGRV